MTDLVIPNEWTSPPTTGIVHRDTVRSMNPEVRDVWCKALLDPKYTQGKHQLLYKAEDGTLRFDALGVLTDVAVLAKASTPWEGMPGKAPTYFFTAGGTPNNISPRVYEWAGFVGMHPSQMVPLEFAGDLHPIWRLTDHFEIPFSNIAAMIETQY